MPVQDRSAALRFQRSRSAESFFGDTEAGRGNYETQTHSPRFPGPNHRRRFPGDLGQGIRPLPQGWGRTRIHYYGTVRQFVQSVNTCVSRICVG